MDTENPASETESKPSDDPVAHAEGFAAEMGGLGYRLDFSLGSLETEIERILGSELFADYQTVVEQACGLPRGSEAHARALERYQLYMRRESGLSAYLGETLRRHFGGGWQGRFSASEPSLNFYLSSLETGNMAWNPSHYFAYRLSNGPAATLPFHDHLAELLAELRG